jgi:hypothetical protein
VRSWDRDLDKATVEGGLETSGPCSDMRRLHERVERSMRSAVTIDHPLAHSLDSPIEQGATGVVELTALALSEAAHSPSTGHRR